MVSDTPSNKDEKRELSTEESAGQEDARTGPVPAEEKDAAVESAMADVAAAIRRHEDHQEDGNEAENKADENTTAEPDTSETKTEDAPTSAMPRHKTSPVPVIAAGVLGGLIGLAGAVALSYAGLLGGAKPAVTTDYESQISALSQEVDALKTSTGGIGKLQSDISSLQQKMNGSSATSGGSADIDALKSEIAALQKSLSSEQNQLQSMSQSLQGSLSDVQNNLAADQQQLQQRLTSLEQKVNTPGKDLAVARAIAAAGLKSAIDRGSSFADELATYAQVAPQGANLSQLQALAQSGIPTREELADQFSAKAEAIIKASAPPPSDENIFNRLIDSAKGLVSVRPVGDVEGDGTPAIVARIENDLNQGTLAQAEAEWQKLPEKARQAADDFQKSLQARIQADKLVSETLSKAIGTTAGVTSSGSTNEAAPASQAGSK